MKSDDENEVPEERQPATTPIPVSELLALCREPILQVSVTDVWSRAAPMEVSLPSTTKVPTPPPAQPPASPRAASIAVRQPRGPSDHKQNKGSWKKNLMRRALAEDNTYRPPHRNPNQQPRWKNKPPTTLPPSPPPARQPARQVPQTEGRAARRHSHNQQRAHNLFESLTSSVAYTPPTSPIGGVEVRPTSPSCQKECHSLGPNGVCHHHAARPREACPVLREAHAGDVVVHEGRPRIMFDYPEYPRPASYLRDRQVGFTDKQLFHYAAITNLILSCMFCGGDTHMPWDCPRAPSPTNLGTAQDRELIDAIRQFGHEATRMYRVIRLVLISRTYHPREIASASRSSLQSQIMGFRSQRVLDSAGLWSFVDANSNYSYTERLWNEANYDLSAESQQARANVTSSAKNYYQKVAKWKQPKALQPQHDYVEPTPIPTVVLSAKKKTVIPQPAKPQETSHHQSSPNNDSTDASQSMPKAKGKTLKPRRKRPASDIQVCQPQNSESSDSEREEAARQIETNLRVFRHQAQMRQEQITDLAGQFAEAITISEGQVSVAPPAPLLPQPGSSNWIPIATEVNNFQTIAPPPESPYARHPSLFIFGAQSSNDTPGPNSPDTFATSTPYWNTVDPLSIRVVSPPLTSSTNDQPGSSSQPQDSWLLNVPPGFTEVPAFRLFNNDSSRVTIPLEALTVTSPSDSPATSSPASPPPPVVAPAPIAVPAPVVMPPPANQSISGFFSSLITREREEAFLRRQYGNKRPGTPRPTRE